MGVALATLPLSVVSDAVGPRSASAQEGSPVKEPAALFKELDKNADGKLSKDEVPEGQVRFHERLLRAAGKKEGDELTQDDSSRPSRKRARRPMPPVPVVRVAPVVASCPDARTNA